MIINDSGALYADFSASMARLMRSFINYQQGPQANAVLAVVNSYRILGPGISAIGDKSGQDKIVWPWCWAQLDPLNLDDALLNHEKSALSIAHCVITGAAYGH